MLTLILCASFFLFPSGKEGVTLTCPHYSISRIWDTQLALYNPQRVPQTLMIQAFDDVGGSVGDILWTLPAEGGFDGSLMTLFPQLGGGTGRLEIRDPSGRVKGHVIYVFKPTQAQTTVPLQAQQAQRLAVPLLEHNERWRSGVAIANPGRQPVEVRLILKFEDGRPADSTVLQLAAGEKVVRMLGQLFTTLPERSQLTLEATQPLALLSLSFSSSIQQMKGQNAEIVSGLPEQAVTHLSEVQGTWKRLGYAGLIHFDTDHFALYHTLDGTCANQYFEGELDAMGVTLFLSQDGTLRMDMAFTQETYYFRREDVSRDTCPLDPNPVVTFEAFVTAMEENYAFFHYGVAPPNGDGAGQTFLDYELKYDNWAAAVAEARALVNSETSDEALFDILTALQDPTNDGHGSLASDFDEMEPAEPTPFLVDVYQHFLDQDQEKDFETFYDQQKARFDTVLTQYVTDLQVTANNRILWGRLNEHTGYLSLSGTDGFSGDALYTEGYSVAILHAEREALEAGLDQAFNDLADFTHLVFDNRWNSGGVDAFSKQVARRFADQKRLAYSETGLYNGGFLPWRSHWIEPHPNRPAYTGTVVYLTSAETASAAEIMTMLMRCLPNVTHIGERTSGSLSDSLDLVLPNGWDLSLSNEIYLDHRGEWWEFRGITPEIQIPHFQRADRENLRDSILEKAVELTGF